MSEQNAFDKMADKFEGGVSICNVRFSKQVDKLIPALVDARKNFPEIPKNGIVKIRTDKASFQFSYATLPDIMKAVDKPLLQEGLYLTQHSRVADRHVVTSTILIHSSGQYTASEYAIPIKNPADPKEVGIATTYSRRYPVCGILGLAPDDDVDAAHSFKDANKIQHRQQRQEQPGEPPTTHRTQDRPRQEPNHYAELKQELEKIGVPKGDKDLADAVVKYCTRHQEAGMVNLSMAYKQPGPCQRAVEAVAEARKSFPGENELLGIVREFIEQESKKGL